MSVHVEPQYSSAHPPAAASGASIGQLTSQVTEQLSRLIRDEMALAQVEAKQRAKRFGLGIGMFGVGGVCLFFAACAGVAAAILALSYVVPAWLAALIVAGAFVLFAGLVAVTGKKSIERGSPPVPTEALRSVRKDAEVVKGALHR
jgi:Flp pilus assembly protein TadB